MQEDYILSIKLRNSCILVNEVNSLISEYKKIGKPFSDIEISLINEFQKNWPDFDQIKEVIEKQNIRWADIITAKPKEKIKIIKKIEIVQKFKEFKEVDNGTNSAMVDFSRLHGSMQINKKSMDFSKSGYLVENIKEFKNKLFATRITEHGESLYMHYIDKKFAYICSDGFLYFYNKKNSKLLNFKETVDGKPLTWKRTVE